MKYYATALAALAWSLAGCGLDLATQTASLGGSVAGERGELKILFINNTDARPAFTFGTYDPIDDASVPQVGQYGAEVIQPVLAPRSSGNLLRFSCGRAFGIGSPTLLTLVERNLGTEDLLAESLVEGVRLVAEDDEAADGAAGWREFYIGRDFNCESILVVRLEINDPGPEAYRVDFDVIPADSTR